MTPFDEGAPQGTVHAPATGQTGEQTQRDSRPAVSQEEALEMASAFDEFFDSAIPESSGREPVPDGDYQAVVAGTEIKKSKTSGKLMLVWRLQILGPTHRNANVWKNSVFQQENMGRLKAELAMCGVSPKPFSQIINDHVHLQGTQLNVNLWTNPNSQPAANGKTSPWVTFVSKVGAPGSAGSAGTARVEASERAPF